MTSLKRWAAVGLSAAFSSAAAQGNEAQVAGAISDLHGSTLEALLMIDSVLHGPLVMGMIVMSVAMAGVMMMMGNRRAHGMIAGSLVTGIIVMVSGTMLRMALPEGAVAALQAGAPRELLVRFSDDLDALAPAVKRAQVIDRDRQLERSERDDRIEALWDQVAAKGPQVLASDAQGAPPVTAAERAEQARLAEAARVQQAAAEQASAARARQAALLFAKVMAGLFAAALLVWGVVWSLRQAAARRAQALAQRQARRDALVSRRVAEAASAQEADFVSEEALPALRELEQARSQLLILRGRGGADGQLADELMASAPSALSPETSAWLGRVAQLVGR